MRNFKLVNKRFSWFAVGSLLLTSLFGWNVNAEQLPSLEDAAAKIQAATVTVRVTSKPSDEDDADNDSRQVTVFSGVSLGDGLIVTPLFNSDGTKVRVTIRGGEQAQARAKVLDEHSGLALLEMDKQDVAKISLADAAPKVGIWVISAAAWGVEDPVVSFGMVSGVDRRMPGTTYPPLVRCNLTTAETSSGAGVVNPKGELVGIIVAADAPGQSRGWTYAVPVKHIHRILRVYKEKAKAKPNEKGDDEVVVITPRRPIVGMEIGGEPDRIIVRRVSKNGPADRAGIKAGDRIIAVDGVKIRSVYQAINPTLFKQPGDKVTFHVEQKDGLKPIEVVLGGGVALPAVNGPELSNLIEPKVIVNGLALRRTLTRPKGNTAEVFSPGDAPEANEPSERKLLEKAIQRYQTVIDIQQGRMSQQQQELDQADKRIRALEAEIANLKKQVGAGQSKSK